jgi:small subunit ribosomal protein S16
MRRPLLVRPAWLICAVPSAVPRSARVRRFVYRWEKTTVVAVKIKLKRLGKIREPYYRIVVADARTKRDGRAIEEIGLYHPKAEPSRIEVNSERVQHWLSVGAQPTDPVRVLLKITGDWQKFTGEPGAEGTLRTAEPRADKKEAFTAAAKASQASKEAKESKAGTQRAAAKPAKDTPPKDSAPKAPKDSAPKGRAKAEAPAAEVPPAAADVAAETPAAEVAPAAADVAAETPAAAAPAAAEVAPAAADVAAETPAAAAPAAAEVAPAAADVAAETPAAEVAPAVAEEVAPAADAVSEGAADAEAAADEPGSGA